MVSRSADLLAAVREAKPLVQCITNFVSMDVTANVLLALGASPAMVHAPEESDEFVRHAAALVCNLGTLSRDWLLSMETAAAAAQSHGKPWVLDPVGAGATQFRDKAVRSLLRFGPAAIRGNASEIIAVARIAGLTQIAATPKGVDSTHTTHEAEGYAVALARHLRCVVAATGAVDIVTDGERIARIANGAPMMARVTALGCALSGVVAAYLAVTDDRFEAVVAALGCYGVAGECAADPPAGPATFRQRFIDGLFNIDGNLLKSRMRVET